jgi:hypothetical protein
MSDPIAIAAVTSTLSNLLTRGIMLDPELLDLRVTTLAPDQARTGITSNQINLFLYQASLNGAWRNMDLPGSVMPGETGTPPLALNLYYLLTAFGRDGSDIEGHRAFGHALSVLHDHPLLGAAELKAALPDSDVSAQLERIRITPQPLTIDEMSKLWTTFQAGYRVSAAYEVAVVLIRSSRPAHTALPVLTRGQGDQGGLAQADLLSPYPGLDSLTPPNLQPAARLGETVVVTGHHLDGTTLSFLFAHPRLAARNSAPAAAGGSATDAKVAIPAAPSAWPAGIYTVMGVVSKQNQPDRTTNSLALPVAPTILGVAPSPAPRDASGNVTLTLTCTPDVLPEQPASLLLGGREVFAEPHPTRSSSVSFKVTAASAGDQYVRLRVDGVDSILVDRTKTPPVFDSAQKVTIT